MSTVWNWPGARWWKCDFHLHSPASDGEDVTPEEWLQATVDAELDAVAVTDHNTGAWIDRVREAARENGRSPVVFPGVELSLHPGIHALILFDPERAGDAVTSFLGRCKIRDTELGNLNACSRLSLTEVMEQARQCGALVIAAHVNEAKGLLKVVEPGQSLQQILTDTELYGVEVNSAEELELLEYLDNSKSGYERRWGPLPQLTFSDAHTTAQIGRRSTWIKMTRPDLEGLRLALRDGPLSILRAEDATTDPNTHGRLVIESLEVVKSKYVGGHEAFEQRLNPWLNAWIGGRGTGKSTLVELLRIALRREDELPEGLEKSFEDFRRVPANRNEKGLLTPHTQIKVTYRKDGGRFRVQWSQDGSLSPILEEGPDDIWSDAPGDVRQRFPVRIYSQKQIFELAEDPEALLHIVDAAPDVGYQPWEEEWRREETRFLALRAKARQLEVELAGESRFRGELDDALRKLAVFEEAGHAEILRELHLRQRQERMLEHWREEASEQVDSLKELAAQLEAPSLAQDLFTPDQPETQGLLTATEKAAAGFVELREEVEILASRAQGLVDEWDDEVQSTPWADAVQRAEERYQTLLGDLEREGVEDPGEYARLVQNRQALEGKLGRLDATRRTLAETGRDAEQSLARLEELRRRLSEKRRRFLESVLQGNLHVRIDLVPYGNRSTAESQLRDLLDQTMAFRKDIDANLERLYHAYPSRQQERGAPNTEAGGGFERKLKELKDRFGEWRVGGGEAVRDQKFKKLLSRLPPETFDRLLLWFPPDYLEVSYSPSALGRCFKSIDQGSPGQKTAALLAFLLSYGEDPIILDQPEDDLDNHLIYDLVVGQLREIKRRRQVVVVTHNPNIVVNGDAELVVALDVRGGQTRQGCEGGLQEQDVRDEVCRVMEGGREAFEKRYTRILAGGTDVRQP